MAPDTLGSRLRGERESRRLTLEQLSASTKIPASLLEALERDDLSRWPKGLYRRAFFRSYVTAIGLPPEPLGAEFARLFCDETSGEPLAGESATTVSSSSDGGQPLTLAPAGAVSGSLARSVGTSLVEVLGVVAAGTLVAWATSIDMLAASGTVALTYYPITRAAAGRASRTDVAQPRAALDAARVRTGAGPGTCAGDMAPLIPGESHRHRAHSGVALAPASVQHLQAFVAGRCVPLAAAATKRTNRIARRAAIRTCATSRRCAQATTRLSVGAISRTSNVVSRGTIASARALGRIAREGIRLSSRARATANQAFWTAVRAAAEQAEVLATRRLNRTRD
jgi:transcriptional regulator with XRE-family HTH domain